MDNIQAIEAYIQANLPDYLNLHRQMVSINSFTANAEGVNALGNLTAALFAGLGLKAERVDSTNPSYGSHLFLTRNTPAEYGSSIALISHLDTVFPPGEEIANDFIWRQEGDRIYGPGTVDIKGGTVMIYMLLDVISRFFPELYEKVSWHVGLNATEEVLSEEFSQACLMRFPSGTRACLVFEGGASSADSYPLVTARKGRATFRVVAEGRSAHAGNYHHLGANAILQIAQTIQKIAALTDYQRQITFNVGTVSGGVVVNRVPHYAEAEVEMRAFSSEVYDQGITNMLALNGSSDVSSSNNGYHCRVNVQVVERTAPWPANPATQALYQVWERASDRLGVRIAVEERGGLSDANLLWSHFPTLDGLGPAGANAHCSERSTDGSKDQEYVVASSFVPKTLLNLTSIIDLLTGPAG